MWHTSVGFFFFFAVFIRARDPVIALSLREAPASPPRVWLIDLLFACPLVHLDLRLSVRLKGGGKRGYQSFWAASPLKHKYERFGGETRQWNQLSSLPLSRSSTQIHPRRETWVGQANSLPQPGPDKQTNSKQLLVNFQDLFSILPCWGGSGSPGWCHPSCQAGVPFHHCTMMSFVTGNLGGMSQLDESPECSPDPTVWMS